MNKVFKISRCCDCPFNDHGQEDKVPMMESYLGYNFKEYFGTSFGGPQLECWYRPDRSFRDNFRGSRHTKMNFIIWKSSWYDGTDIMFDFHKQPEFKEQLIGFPKRCPLEEEGENND